jgi:hypothetical protein
VVFEGSVVEAGIQHLRYGQGRKKLRTFPGVFDHPRITFVKDN